MSLIPDTRAGKIEFAEDHVTPWTTNAVAIGTTSTAVTAWSAKVTAARDAYQAQQAAQNAAKAATNTLNIAMDALTAATSDIIKQIRTQAALSGDSVYSLAEIPAPATPGPVGAPGTAYKFKSTLKPNGSIEMTWKCNNPAGCHGVIYQIYRRVESTGEYLYLGGTGERKFVDAGVPAGVATVYYQIQGTRSTSVGDAAEFVVNLGVSSSTGSTAFLGTSTPKGTPAKVAA